MSQKALTWSNGWVKAPSLKKRRYLFSNVGHNRRDDLHGNHTTSERCTIRHASAQAAARNDNDIAAAGATNSQDALTVRAKQRQADKVTNRALQRPWH